MLESCAVATGFGSLWYVFSVRSAAVLGSSSVSTPNTPELYQVSPAPHPAAPEDGRTPLNSYSLCERAPEPCQAGGLEPASFGVETYCRPNVGGKI